MRLGADGRRPTSGARDLRGGWRSVWLSAGFALAYAAAAWLGRATRVEATTTALLWPAGGVGFLWLGLGWRAPGRLAVNLLALTGLAAAVTFSTGASPAAALVFAVSSGGQAAVCCVVLDRLQRRPGTTQSERQPALPESGLPESGLAQPGPAGLWPWRLRRPVDLAHLVFAAGAGAAAGAVIGVAGLRWAASVPVLPASLGQWALRQAASTFVVAAVALRLAEPTPPPARLAQQRLELVATALALAAGYALVFGGSVGLPLAFLLLPLSMWVALRFDTAMAAAHVLLVAVFVALATLHGRGPFGTAPPATRAVLAQAFVVIVGLVTLVLALDRDERHALLARLAVAGQAATEQAGLLDAVINRISDGVVVAGADGTLLLRNPAAGRLLGIDVGDDEVHGKPAGYRLTRPDGSPFPTAELPLVRALAGEELNDVELHVQDPEDPQGRILNVSARPLPGPAGRHSAVLAFHDVTAARRAQAALAHQALHDPLTGLANRALLADRLGLALAAGGRSAARTGVVYLDLDGFKAVNDTAGHAAGDELLVQTAQRLRRAVRPGDTVARLGGDEFAAVCCEVHTMPDLQLIADRIAAVLQAPFELATGSRRVGASIGLALSEDTATAEQLLHRADQAMYRAKRAGRPAVPEPRTGAPADVRISPTPAFGGARR